MLLRIVSTVLLTFGFCNSLLWAADPVDSEIQKTEERLTELKRQKSIPLGQCKGEWVEESRTEYDEYEGRTTRNEYKVLVCTVVAKKTRCKPGFVPRVDYKVYESRRRYVKEDVGTECNCYCKVDPDAKSSRNDGQIQGGGH